MGALVTVHGKNRRASRATIPLQVERTKLEIPENFVVSKLQNNSEVWFGFLRIHLRVVDKTTPPSPPGDETVPFQEEIDVAGVLLGDFLVTTTPDNNNNNNNNNNNS